MRTAPVMARPWSTISAYEISPVSGSARRLADTPKPLMKVRAKPARSISRAESASKQQGITRRPGASSRSWSCAAGDFTAPVLARGGRGQPHREARVATGLGLDGDVAAVVADDLVAECQAEAGAFPHRARGEERVEDAVDHAGRDAAAVVLDAHHHAVARALGDEPDPSRRAHGLEGVEDEVEEDLAQLVRRTAHRGDIPVAALDGHRVAERGHVGGVLHQLVQDRKS